MQVNITTTSIDDITEITSPDWNGKIITLTRLSYDKWRSSDSIPETAAIYILTSNRYNEPGKKNSIYIGHTESVKTRIETHAANKDFWTAAFVLTSREDWMNIAFTKNIECKFIELAKLANRYTVTNGNDGGSTHLGVEDLEKLNTFIIGVKSVFKIARLDFFELNMNGVFTKTSELQKGRKKEIFKLHVTDINPNEKTMKIISGSKFFSCEKLDINIDGLVFSNDVIEFTKDAVVPYGEAYLPRILNKISLHGCVSENGLKIHEFIKAATNN